MKLKDLRQYKPLDITELPGKEWSIAEKVLGLDENDKVVMAEPEELVTPEYVDNAIDQAMEAETARTESTYLKEHQSLDDYATKQYVDDAISEIDLSDYYTKEEVDEAIENVDVSDQLVNYALISSVTEDINTAIANETARTENTYAKPSDIPSLDGYAKTTAVTQDIQTAIASETARTENVYAKKSEIPSLDGYATEDWVESQGYLTEHQSLDGYAKTTAVTQDIQSAIASETARTEDTYAKKSDIPDLDNYYTKAQTDVAITAATDDMATETWVQNQGYLTQHQDISGKLDVSTFNTYTGATETVLEGKADLSDIPDVSDFVTSGDVATQIGTAMGSETARTESVYAKKSELPDLTNYYTKAQTNSAITAATEGLASEQWVEDKVDGHYEQEELEIGQSDQNWYSLTFDNTSQMFMTTNVTGIDMSDVSQAFHPNVAYSLLGMDNPYTLSRLIVDLENDFVLTPGNINTEFTFIDPGEDWDWKNGVILRPENFPDGYPAYFIINKATYTGRFSFTPTIQGDWVPGKLDETVFSTYTGATATAIAAKQDTLVSGTNIKTINNQSLLGSGNIDIQGGGGGGETVVELTKAQYEALNPPAADTTYIITDADVVDLNDYAMASGLTELSGTVETLSTTVSGKADKVNTTARSAPYLPSWNAQGIITGSSIHYEGAFNMNGTALGSVIKTGNSAGATWFAPTSKGTAGQVLQSPSSGNEPTWSTYKFAFITQTQYDALSTKDATTIYFITGE